MHNYTITQTLRQIWEHAVAQYQAGNRDPDTYFSEEMLNQVHSIGATPQEIYDYAEDWVSGQEPDFTTFALCAEIRRHYFTEVQKGKPSGNTLNPASLPAKTESAEGIEWLPRIIPKAKAKLRGELSPDIMYGCGGDRNFLKTHDIHPAQFLRIVEKYENDDLAIIRWVVAHKQSLSKS